MSDPKSAMLELALRAAQQHMERDEYTAAGEVVMQALAWAEQIAAPASDLRAFGMKVGHEIAGWIDANDPLPDVEAIVDQILAAAPQGATQ